MKFKVGDRVRVIGSTTRWFREGDVGTVQPKLDDDDFCLVHFDAPYCRGDGKWFVLTYKLELIEEEMKFKIGDIVRITGTKGISYCGAEAHFQPGSTATITHIDADDTFVYLLLDKSKVFGAWAARDASLELIESEEEKSPKYPSKYPSKYQIVYKLVDNRDGVLGSWAVPGGGKWYTTYSMFIKTKQLNEEHPLFAFDSIANAKKLAWGISHEVILKCLARIGGSKPPDYPNDFGEPAEGTVFCRWVIPFEVVEE